MTSTSIDQNHIASKDTLSTRLLVIILLFASLAHVMADMYVPSLPAITEALGSNPVDIQLTLTAFMAGFSIGHLFYGPLSDAIGRRKPMLIGIGVSLVGSACCVAAHSVSLLIIGRLLQGLGVAVCNSVGRSIVSDLITGSHLAKLSSHLGMIMVFVTATAPTLGGYIQYYFNWRIVFLILLLYTSVIWLLTWWILPETNTRQNPKAIRPIALIHNYWAVIRHPQFLGYTLCVSAAYAGIIAYVTTGPFLLQNIIGLTPIQYGWLAFVIGAAIFSSFFINSRVVLKVGINRLILLGSICMLLAGGSMGIFALLPYLSTWMIILPVAIYCMGAGFTFSNASAGAIQPFANLAGSAGALFGFLQILGGVSASAFVAKLHYSSQLPLACIFIFCGLTSLLSLKMIAAREHTEFTSCRQADN